MRRGKALRPMALRDFLYQFVGSVAICAALLGIAACVYYDPGVNSVNAIVAEETGSSTPVAESPTPHEPLDLACKETYGFLPCSKSLGGSLVLMAFYGGVLMYAAQCIGDGGEGLLDLGIMSPTIIGGLLLPVLGAVPDAVIIAVSAASGSIAKAEDRISVGVGTLAGSTIMLLTITFSGCLFVGRCDLDANGEAIDSILNGERYSKKSVHAKEYENICGQLTSSGLTHNKDVLMYKHFMLATSLIYVLVQIPASLYGSHSADTRMYCGIVGIVAYASLLIYLISNLSSNSGEQKKSARRENKLVSALEDYHNQFGPNPIEVFDPVSGKANHAAIRDLFHAFDLDGNGYLDEKEIERFTSIVFLSKGDKNGVPKYVVEELINAQAEKGASDPEAASGCLRKGSKSNKTDPNRVSIDQDVFIARVGYLLESEQSKQLEERTSAIRESVEDNEDEDEQGMSLTGALLSILTGTVLVTIFSDGVVDAIDSFGKNSGIPNFIIGFVVCPFASNASELFSSLQFAARKKQKNSSVTYSQIYAACTMNNTMCLGVLLTMVWSRNLHWDYAAEVISILAATWIIGLLTGSRTTMRTWFGIVAILVYPFSLGLVEVLHAVGLK